GATVVIPAPICSTVSVVPTVYATDEFGGIQNVLAEALFMVMNRLASPNTGVYVLPVCALAVVELSTPMVAAALHAVGDALPAVALHTTVLAACDVSPANGKPVALVSVTDAGVPSTGVTNVGDVANTAAPEPVSFVSAAAKLADVGVPKNVATPVAKPLTPVEIGNPVAFVSVADVGVPNTGVTNVGDVANTAAPVPVSSANAAAKFALEGVARNVPTPVPMPVTPDIGAAVAVIVPLPLTARLAPVPTTIAAVVFVLPVNALNAVEPPEPQSLPVPLTTPNVLTFKHCVEPVINDSVTPVAMVGLVSEGDVPNTAAPDPVSSVNAAARLAL